MTRARIIDPLTARSQVNGGVLMGIGFALFEDRRMDPQLGIMVNPTMDDYKLVGALDVPQIDVTFLEVDQRHHEHRRARTRRGCARRERRRRSRARCTTRLACRCASCR